MDYLGRVFFKDFGLYASRIKTLLSLNNVTNTSDANKPVSTATQTALDAKAPSTASYLVLNSDAGLQNERIITAGALVDLADGGAGSTLTIDVDLSEAGTITPAVDDTIPLTDTSASNANGKATVESLFFERAKIAPRYGFEFFTDFINETSTTATDGALSETNSGTGAAVSQVGPNEAGVIGMAQSATGTTNTGRAALLSGTSCILLGGGTYFFEARVRVPTLSGATERFQFVIGFIDTSNAANQADGVFFLYDEGGVSTGSAASANWQTVTSAASSRTFTTTGTAVDANTWVRLGIEINADGSSVTFFINGTSVATHTSNIPTASGRGTGFGSILIKSAGTTSRTADCDYINVIADLTTTR